MSALLCKEWVKLNAFELYVELYYMRLDILFNSGAYVIVPSIYEFYLELNNENNFPIMKWSMVGHLWFVL